MAEARAERRLAAILAADIAGYGRLMGEDEEGTLARLKAYRSELIDPKNKQHRGRIVKTTGDGILMEFPSIVDAVRCAIEVQQGMVERNADVPQEKRIEFRVGVNLGDVMIEGRDLYGDGVNIAARLEAFAEPGGICISQTVLNHARDKVAFDVGGRGRANSEEHRSACPCLPHRRRSSAAGGQCPSQRRRLSLRRTNPRLPCCRSPNMSGDPEQEYFADGISEDIITGLSKLRCFLLSRAIRHSPTGARRLT